MYFRILCPRRVNGSRRAEERSPWQLTVSLFFLHLGTSREREVAESEHVQRIIWCSRQLFIWRGNHILARSAVSPGHAGVTDVPKHQLHGAVSRPRLPGCPLRTPAGLRRRLHARAERPLWDRRRQHAKRRTGHQAPGRRGNSVTHSGNRRVSSPGARSPGSMVVLRHPVPQPPPPCSLSSTARPPESVTEAGTAPGLHGQNCHPPMSAGPVKRVGKPLPAAVLRSRGAFLRGAS